MDCPLAWALNHSARPRQRRKSQRQIAAIGNIAIMRTASSSTAGRRMTPDTGPSGTADPLLVRRVINLSPPTLTKNDATSKQKNATAVTRNARWTVRQNSREIPVAKLSRLDLLVV